jgi:hypothetical protein
MTISNQNNRVDQVGNGSTSTIVVPFPVHTPYDDLRVVSVVIATGVDSDVSAESGWTWSGTANDRGHYPNGGTITIVAGAWASTIRMVVYRDPDPVQELDLVEDDSLPVEEVEAQLDYLTMLIQRLEDRIDRSLRQPDGDEVMTELPNTVDRASKYLAFDSAGDPTVVDPETASGTSVTATGSTTARLLAERFADLVNVKDFGAVGDGSTDDSAAVQAAAVAAEGKVLWFPNSSGAYMVNGIAISANTIVAGYGTLKSPALLALDDSPILELSGNNVEITGLTFDGNKSAHAADGFSDSYNTGSNSTGRAYRAAIRAAELVDINVHHCHFKDTYGAGLATLDCARVTFSNNTTKDLNFEAAFIYKDNGTVTDILISDNRIDTCESGHASVNANGILVGGADGILRVAVTGNVIYNTERNFIKFEGGTGVVCTGNTGHTSSIGTYPGISTQHYDVDGMTISGNTIVNAGIGITIAGASGKNVKAVNVSGNVVSTTAGTHGILLDQNSATTFFDITVKGNLLRDINSHGIYLTGASPNRIVIQDNTLFGQEDDTQNAILLTTSGAAVDILVDGNVAANFVEDASNDGVLTIDRSSSGTWANLVVTNNVLNAAAAGNRALHITAAAGAIVSGVIAGNYLVGKTDGNVAQGWIVGVNYATGAWTLTGLTYTDADTTPSVLGLRSLTLTNTGATSITTFDDMAEDQEVKLLFTDGNTTLVDAAGLQLAGSANFVGSANDILTIIKIGGVIYEVGRSVN